MVTYAATTVVEYQPATSILRQSEVAPLMQRLEPKFHGILRNLSISQAAYEDIFQQTALNVLRCIQRGTTHIRKATAEQYVKQIFVNACRRYAKKEKRRMQQENEGGEGQSLEEVIASAQETPLETMIEEEEQQHMRELVCGTVNELKERDRQLIDMHYLQGLKNKIIAERLMLRYDTLKIKIFRAKEKLEKLLWKKEKEVDKQE